MQLAIVALDAAADREAFSGADRASRHRDRLQSLLGLAAPAHRIPQIEDGARLVQIVKGTAGVATSQSWCDTQ
jgi:hypothetical protein